MTGDSLAQGGTGKFLNQGKAECKRFHFTKLGVIPKTLTTFECTIKITFVIYDPALPNKN